MVVSAATCAAFVLMLIGAVSGYRYHRVLKLKDEFFFDVAGKIFLSVCYMGCFLICIYDPENLVSR